MASSDDEAGPSDKRIKLDSTEPIMDVRDMNKLFPKIDNLEHFPLKVLMNIFSRLDYMDLYNLAEKSTRFERIAKIVLNEKYAHEYLIVDETKNKKETYIEFFKRFGSEIKWIKAKNMEDPSKRVNRFVMPETPWITSLLNKAKNLEKLILEEFHVEFLFWHVNKSITHLTFRGCYDEPRDGLSEFRNFKKVEILNWALISFDSLATIIRNNPSLEGLVLADNYYTRRPEIGPRYPFNRLMELIATNLNQLKEFGYVPRSIFLPQQIQTDRPANHIIDGFFNCLTQLESLALSSNVDIFMDFAELLRRLQSTCKSTIKHLKLYDIDSSDAELFNIIRSFDKVERLTLACTEFDDEIYTAVEHSTFLRELDVALHTEDDIDWSFVLKLLRKCPTLEKLTVAGDASDREIEIFGTSQFYDQFIATVQQRDVELIVKFKDQIIGSISKSEVTWRNKLVRWTSYNQNSSGVNLLDLVKGQSNADAGAEQTSPFDLVLGYLDLNSLYSLSKVSKKCAHLVENHVKQHSQEEDESFTITDEFNCDYGQLEMFAEYVTNVRINILYEHIDDLQFIRDILVDFNDLTEMYIHTEGNVNPHHLIVPQARHLVFDGPHFRYYYQLHELSVMCPDLDTLELKQEVSGCFDEEEKEPLEFHNLKRFELKYEKRIEYLVENLQAIFKGTNTKLCLNI